MADSVVLPPELLLEIALKSPSTFYAMATAIPFVGRYSMCMQDKLKAHFSVSRECIGNGYIPGIETILPNGERHSNYDNPAVKRPNGTLRWYRNGKLHRDNDLPATIYADGKQEWCQNGKLHRDNDLPAIIEIDGTHVWYQNGKRHRDNDLPAYSFFGRTHGWFQSGKLHRDNDKPAVVCWNGSVEYWRDGVRYTPVV